MLSPQSQNYSKALLLYSDFLKAHADALRSDVERLTREGDEKGLSRPPLLELFSQEAQLFQKSLVIFSELISSPEEFIKKMEKLLALNSSEPENL